jgi:putative flippase GtrA
VHLARVLPRRWRLLPHEAAKFATIGLGSLTRFVPQRWHSLAHEVAKFGTIGVINLVVNVGVSNLLVLTVLQGGEVKAKAVAAIVATTCAYFMNRHWTYRDRPKSTLHREYMLFFLFNIVGFVIETGTVAFTKYGLHQTHIIAFNISTGIGIGLGTLFRFWAYRTHVFKLATPEPYEAPLTYEVVLPDPRPLPDDGLSDELTQIELDSMVDREQQPTRRS